MNARILLSFSLIALALILVFLPKKDVRKNNLKPGLHLETLYNSDLKVSVDMAARYLNTNETNIQFIDLRTPQEFKKSNIPGSINIPYEQLLDKKLQGYLNQDEKVNILYSNGDLLSNLSLSLLHGIGYKNNIVLTGGMNKWFALVMQSDFKGGQLSARENALYENRKKARILFTEINSLPDSLKNTHLEARMLEELQLDGGCE